MEKEKRKRKNSAPLPSIGKKVSQGSNYPPFSQPIASSSQAAMHDSGHTSLSQGAHNSRRTSSSTNSSVCTECGSVVSTEDDYTFSCSVCKNLYRGKCLDFDESTLDLISAVFDSITWTCNQCQTNAKSFTDKKPLKSKNQAQLTQAKITSLENEVELLRTRILTLENLISNVPPNASSSMQMCQSSGTDLTGTSKSIPPNVRQELSASDNKSERQMNAITSSVMKAVHGDLLNKKHRQRNLVISGFKPSSTIGDKDLFKDLYASHFDLRPIPEPVLCRRLIPRDQNGSRNKNPNRISPLLVVLQTDAQAQYIISNARSLRNSNSEYTKNNVYINRDLTKLKLLQNTNIGKEDVRRPNSSKRINHQIWIPTNLHPLKMGRRKSTTAIHQSSTSFPPSSFHRRTHFQASLFSVHRVLLRQKATHNVPHQHTAHLRQFHQLHRPTRRPNLRQLPAGTNLQLDVVYDWSPNYTSLRAS